MRRNFRQGRALSRVRGRGCGGHARGWHDRCQRVRASQANEGRLCEMKEITNSIAQFVAVIMLMITLAVCTAALSLWANTGAAAQEQAPPAQTLDVARTGP